MALWKPVGEPLKEAGPVANATPRDTRAGFDIFRSFGGQISLDDLNARLVAAGYGPVALRTFKHYGNLLDAGYNRYVSINRFDVARAAAPYESASANGRYSYRDADAGVSVVFAKASKLLEAYGRASELGEVGAILQFEDQGVIDGLVQLRPQAGDMVTLRFLEHGRTVGGRVIEADLKSRPALVEVEYSRLLSIAAIGIGVPLPSVEASFVLRGTEDDQQTVDIVGRRLYYFFELLEGLRSLSNGAGSRQPDPVYAEPPVVKRLSVASPAELIIEIAGPTLALLPFGLAAAAIRAAGYLVTKRKEWHEGTGQVKQNQLADIEVELKQLDVDLKRLEVEAKQAETALRIEMLQKLAAGFPSSTLTTEEATQTIDDYVLPPLRALGEIGIQELAPPPGDGTKDGP